MGQQPREHFLHEDLAVFAPPLRVVRVDRIFAESDTLRAAEEQACHAFGHDDDAGSVVELFVSCVRLGRVAVWIKLKCEGGAAEDGEETSDIS